MTGGPVTGRKVDRGIDPDIMIKRDEVSAQYVVDFLNEILRLDKYALTDMMSEGISVNKELKNHPTVLVIERVEGVPEIGLLSILNGLFGLEGETFAIEVIRDERTEVIREFKLTEPWKGWTGPQAV